MFWYFVVQSLMGKKNQDQTNSVDLKLGKGTVVCDLGLNIWVFKL